MRLANCANAVLLVLTGVWGFFAALDSPSADTFSSVMLSLYVCGFGALLARYVFWSSEALRRDHGYMYSFAGRAAFLLLSANLAWTIEPLGFAVAILTNANAVFSGYVLWRHPAFLEGQESRTAIGSVDSSAAGPGASSSGFQYAADPASNAARAQAGFARHSPDQYDQYD